MKSIVKPIIISLIITILFSCDLLSNLMSKNYFSGLEGDESFTVSVSDFDVVGEDAVRVADKYSDMALNPEESKKLFLALGRDSDALAAKDALSELLNSQIKSIEDIGLDNLNIAQKDRYQKLNYARAKVEVLPVDKLSVEGYNGVDATQMVLVGYESGLITEKFDSVLIRSKLFGITSETTVEEKSEITTTLKNLFSGINVAGDSIKNIGNTISDRDYPESAYISDDEAPFLLFVLVINNIIEKSLESDSYSDVDSVIDDLIADIINNSFSDSAIVYPKSGTSSSDPISWRYLGELGSYVFSATGYTLPSALLLGGGSK